MSDDISHLCQVVWNILSEWYEGRMCFYWHTPFGRSDMIDDKPALMSPEFKTIGWTEISPEQLPVILDTHVPVCQRCHLAQPLRLVIGVTETHDSGHRMRSQSQLESRPVESDSRFGMSVFSLQYLSEG